MSDFNKLIAYVSGGIILILLAVAIFLISNTVTVGISVRREEIAIMKLIGIDCGSCRLPIKPFSVDEYEKLRGDLDAIKFFEF